MAICLAGVVAACFPANAVAQVPGPIVRIEEDWTVQVGVPNPDENAPQIITILSPRPTLDWVYAIFELNHATQPEYTAGGMQLQRWLNDSLTEYRGYPNPAILATDSETITYTVAMYLENGQLQFEVLNGHSTTWGNFGGQGYLKSCHANDLPDFSAYSPETSIKYSRIGYASYRVKKFARTQVRYYSAAGLVNTDSTERVVHSYDGGN